MECKLGPAHPIPGRKDHPTIPDKPPSCPERSGFTDTLISWPVLRASAQQAPSPPPTTPYGAPIGLEAAKNVMAAAEAEAVKNNWGMAIAILDSTGHIVMLHKLDNTQYGSIAVAEDKARSALSRLPAVRGRGPWRS